MSSPTQKIHTNSAAQHDNSTSFVKIANVVNTSTLLGYTSDLGSEGGPGSKTRKLSPQLRYQSLEYFHEIRPLRRILIVFKECFASIAFIPWTCCLTEVNFKDKIRRLQVLLLQTLNIHAKLWTSSVPWRRKTPCLGLLKIQINETKLTTRACLEVCTVFQLFETRSPFEGLQTQDMYCTQLLKAKTRDLIIVTSQGKKPQWVSQTLQGQ